MLGSELGPYRIVSELGSGGMGTVYRAEDEAGRTVALKILHPHLLSAPGAFKRFLREAEIGRHLDHENVVATIDVDAIESDGKVHHYLVMEFVEGRNLKEILDEQGPLGETMLRDVALQVTAGLAAIHDRGIIHRDLKPENILVTPAGRVRIMDLGLAKLQEASIAITRSGHFTGSLLYSAPEQFKLAEVGAGSDLYSLGVVLYELATGKNPFARETPAAVVQAQLDFVPPLLSKSNSHVSLSFAAIVQALLEKEPANRLGTAEDLLAVLEGRTLLHTVLRLETDSTSHPLREAVETVMVATALSSEKVFGPLGTSRRRWRIRVVRYAALVAIAALVLVAILLI